MVLLKVRKDKKLTTLGGRLCRNWFIILHRHGNWLRKMLLADSFWPLETQQ